jgi:uncharacterized protein YbaR (Trm112 family)
MALIICPDCKQELSTNTAICPHCGKPIASRDATLMKAIGSLLVCGGLLIAFAKFGRTDSGLLCPALMLAAGVSLFFIGGARD